MLHHSDYQDTPLAQDFAESDDGFRPSRDQTRPIWEGLCAHGDLHLDSCDLSWYSYNRTFLKVTLDLRLSETELELERCVYTWRSVLRYLIFVIPEYFYNYSLVKTTLVSAPLERKFVWQRFCLFSWGWNGGCVKAEPHWSFKAIPSLGLTDLFGKRMLLYHTLLYEIHYLETNCGYVVSVKTRPF